MCSDKFSLKHALPLSCIPSSPLPPPLSSCSHLLLLLSHFHPPLLFPIGHSLPTKIQSSIIKGFDAYPLNSNRLHRLHPPLDTLTQMNNINICIFIYTQV